MHEKRIRQIAINHDNRRNRPYTYRRDDDDSFVNTVATVLAVEAFSGAFDSSPSPDPSFGGFDGGESGGAGASGSWDSSSSSSDSSSSSSYDSGSSSCDSGSSSSSDF